jgi:signal transduction histidine kinase/AraC-like DNA-binding protein
LYFNTQKGYYVFSPEKIKQNLTPPHIVLEEFKLFDKKVTPNENLSLTTLLNQTKKLDLSHEENVFSFAFTGIHFSNPEENQHLYMLENYDDTWRKAGADRTASFHKVPPGKYIFRVKASNSDGIWAEKTIPIEIHPPWWQTTWAYIGYLLAFVAILYALRHYTISRERLKTRLLLKQMEADKLHELEAVRSRFFANISHEFRTPLTLIIGPLEKLLNKPEEQHNHTLYRMMERNASRLQTLINQLLDLSKLEVGSLKLEMHPGNVETFLHVVSAPFASIAESRNITFHTHIACAETVVLFDSDKVEKIVVNLLSNAFKFTPDGGTIHLHASLNPTAELDQIYLLEIIVSDNGIGIAPNLIDKIFDRFYQIDGSHTREKEGTGIGLSLTKELVELHKGSIDVISESGKGTSFTVRLPLKIHQAKSPDMVSLVGQTNKSLPPSGVQVSKDEHISTADDLTGESETIQEKPLLLIIEDNKELSTFIASHFKPQYEVLIAADGQVGLQQALASAPDIIISDVMMPVMDGIALCKRLKADERTSHIPIILLTAKASESSKLEGLHTGADDYLTKPFKGAELQARVHNLIESRKQLRDKFSREVKLQPAEVLITSADETLLMNIMSILEANFMDPTFSLESFEKKAGMSRTQFYRKMKALTNEAPGEFLRNFRLQKAAMLLKGSYGNISEIAYGVGFNSLSYFTRCFKEFYGQSPSEYIAAQGNKTPVTDPSLT